MISKLGIRKFEGDIHSQLVEIFREKGSFEFISKRIN